MTTGRKIRRAGCGAYTLLELLVAVSLCALLTLAALTSLTFTIRGERSLANYSEMNERARRMLEQLGRDLRATGGVPALGYSSTSLQLSVPSDLTGTNWQTVTWSYDATTATLTRRVAGGSPVVYATNVRSFNFKYFNNSGAVPTSEVDLKQVQLSMSMQRYLGTTNSASVSDYVISAQFTLRAKTTAV